jgi:hypothetical protein
MKKIALILFVTLQIATVTGIASAIAPLPDCLPCKGIVAGR